LAFGDAGAGVDGAGAIVADIAKLASREPVLYLMRVARLASDAPALIAADNLPILVIDERDAARAAVGDAGAGQLARGVERISGGEVGVEARAIERVSAGVPVCGPAIVGVVGDARGDRAIAPAICVAGQRIDSVAVNAILKRLRMAPHHAAQRIGRARCGIKVTTGVIVAARDLAGRLAASRSQDG
jgi:hypothetical protein